MPKGFRIRTDRDKSGWLFVFMTGFVLGVLLINFGGDSGQMQEGLLNRSILERMKDFHIDSGRFLVYVLEDRLKVVLGMALLATTVVGIAGAYAYMGWLGISLGVLLAVMTVQFGIKGTLLFVCCVFPQYLVYIPLSIGLVNWCCQVCGRLYFPTDSSYGRHGSPKQQILGYALRLCAMIGVVIIGCLLECYVNPIIVNSMIRFF